MKALAVLPGTPHSLHLREIERPSLDAIPNGRGVLVKVLQVGVDATDMEINEALYGNAPEGNDYLVIGHEVFGQVEATGDQVRHVQPGDYVTCTVRRPGKSIYDHIGRSDITSEETYYERGINLLHGFMTEYFVDDAAFVVKYPAALKSLGVLSEPASVCAKAIQQAYAAQHRLQVWEPQRAWVMGAGQIGLLSTMLLKLRGLEVCTMARSPAAGNLKAELAEQFGAKYISTRDVSLEEIARQEGRPDLIIEATGNSHVAFSCMNVLNLNGALVLTSVTGGSRRTEIDSDRINLEWVLGNKLLLGSVNSNFRHFQEGIAALALGAAMYPGVLDRMLTHPIQGMEEHERIMPLLADSSALKVFVNIA